MESRHPNLPSQMPAPDPTSPTSPESPFHEPPAPHLQLTPSYQPPPPNSAYAAPPTYAYPYSPAPAPPPNPAPYFSPSPSEPAKEAARSSKMLPHLVVWTPIVISLLSLTISIVSAILTSSPPDTVLSIADRIRVGQLLPAGQVVTHPYVYMQPAFFTTSQTQRTELILRMKLRMVPVSGGVPTDFTWNSVGTWQLLGSGGQAYIYSSDAGPLIVNPSNPQTPICEFDGPPGWGFKVGSYNATLTADRALVSSPLQTSFSFSVDQGAVDTINQNRGFVVLNINRLSLASLASCLLYL